MTDRGPKASRVASRHLKAAIQQAPRYADKYLRMFWGNVQNISRFFSNLSQEIASSDPEDFQSFFFEISGGNFHEGSFWWVKELGGDSVLPSLEYYLKNNRKLDKRSLGNILSEIREVKQESEEGLQDILSLNPNAIRKEYPGFKINVSERVASSIASKLLKSPALALKLKMWLKDAVGKLGELERSFSGTPPQTEKLEVLYHTSIKAKTLARTGFHLGPAEAAGLGGLTTTKSGKNAISFTSDLYIAKEIMRALKESILIAHGQVKRRHVLEWSAKEGFLNKVLKGYHSNAESQLNPEDPFAVFTLYRTYLTFSKRFNPTFFGNQRGLFKIFSRATVKDAGILVCQVDMTNPDMDYLPSMREYRIPAGSVRRILKVIS